MLITAQNNDKIETSSTETMEKVEASPVKGILNYEEKQESSGALLEISTVQTKFESQVVPKSLKCTNIAQTEFCARPELEICNYDKIKEDVRENTSNITNIKESIFESFPVNEKDISNAINGTWLNENIGNNGISYIGANFKKQNIIDDKWDNNICKHIDKDVPYVSNEVFGVSSQIICERI